MISIGNDFLQYLRIIRTPGVGAKTLHSLLARYDYDEAIMVLGQKFDVCPESTIQKEIDDLKKLNGAYIFPKDFPENLKAIDSPPMCLTAIGNIDLLNQHVISIVGGRNASFQGRRFTENLSKTLSEKGYVICSGFARGIDTAAHKGAVNGKTTAVFAGGVDHVYPLENKALYTSIIDSGGLILSEMAPGTKPLNTLFPRRNRIVAALCEKLIVVEASEHSGSMITTKYALDQGKDIYCVPGHPEDPRVTGCHRLIQNGAYLLHDAGDILQHNNTVLKMPPSKKTKTATNEAKKNKADTPPSHIKGNAMQPNDVYYSEELSRPMVEILDQLSASPMAVELLHQNTRLPLDQLMETLTDLELQNLIQRTWDGKIFRIF